MSGSPGDPLARALRADRAEDIVRALLDAWARGHHPVIAELVAAAARRAREANRPRVLADTLAARQAQWLALAAVRDPLALDWLIEHFAPPHADLAMVRIAELVNWPDDPRIATGLLAMSRTRPLLSHRPLWTQIFRAIRKRIAHHLAPQINELVGPARITTFDVYLQGKLAVLTRDLAALPEPEPLDPVLLAALETKLEVTRDRVSRKTADDFLRAIWAAPDDDGPRAVFADWLSERGDLRGELIALQLARSARKAAVRRERALIADHGRAWMGVLEPVVARGTLTLFDRGFLYRCEVRWRRLAALPRLMTHPAWSTVREYRLEIGGDRECDRWLDHMVASGARRV